MAALMIARKVLLASIIAYATVLLPGLFVGKALARSCPDLLFLVALASASGMVMSSVACVVLQIAVYWAASRRR
jgi:hypothetical protein